MAYIKIDEDSRLLVEEDNCTIQYRSPKGGFNGKKGVGFIWKNSGFFPILDSALKDWVINAPSRQKDGRMTVLADVVKVIQDAEAHIDKLIHKK